MGAGIHVPRTMPNRLTQPNHVISSWDRAAGTWCGSFDYADLAAWIVSLVKNPPSPTSPVSPKSFGRAVADHLAKLPTPVSALTDLSLGNPWETVTEDTELGAIVGVLGGGVRRIGVIGANGTDGGLVGVLTQRWFLVLCPMVRCFVDKHSFDSLVDMFTAILPRRSLLSASS